MSNCKNCGEPLRPGAMFCAKCGTPVTDEEPKNSNINIPVETKIETDVDDNNKKKKSGCLFTILKIVIGIIVFLYLVGLFFGKSDNEGTKKEVVSPPVKNEQAVTINSAKSALESFGIKGEIISSTYNNNTDGFLANVDNKVYVVDLKNNQIATIENYSVMVRNVHKIRGRDNSSGNLIPQFLIYNDKHGKDDQMGEWRGNNHFLPIYILVECDAAGNIKSRGKMSSGLGAAPSHYQGYLEEQKNIDIANIFLKDILTFIQIPRNEAVNQGSYTNSSMSSPVYIGVINGDEVNVRKGPGVKFDSLGVFFKGDKVRLVGEQGNDIGETWYQIEYDNPTVGLIKGWVRKDYININQVSDNTSSNTSYQSTNNNGQSKDVFIEHWNSENLDIYVVDESLIGEITKTGKQFTVMVKQVQNGKLIKTHKWSFTENNGEWRYSTEEMDKKGRSSIVSESKIFEYCMKRLGWNYVKNGRYYQQIQH